MKIDIKTLQRTALPRKNNFNDTLHRYYQVESSKLEDWLKLKFGSKIADHLPNVLLKPFRDLSGRRGKRIRGRLVEIGYQLAFPRRINLGILPKDLHKLSEAVELLHSGSLVVDDLQDGSKMRRGEPTLHLKYGLPIALNTGNWLYFWPLEIIRSLNLPHLRELEMYRYYHRTLVRAHVGQALDVGLPVNKISQKKLMDLCLATIELKSGALFALSLVMGAMAGGADDQMVQSLDRFGHGFGMMLQMYDDLGNMKGRVEPAKRWEDLLLKRLTWAWAFAADHYPKPHYDRFVAAVNQLPQDRHLLRWLETHNFMAEANKHIQNHFETCAKDLEQNLKHKSCNIELLRRIRQMGEEISKAYG